MATTKELGRGAFGVVYLGRCTKSNNATRLGQLRVIKKISKSVYDDCEKELVALGTFCVSMSTADEVERYNHNFVAFLGWFDTIEDVFIIMEYVEYGDLRRYVKAALPERECKSIVYQIADAIKYIHKRGFAHRDLKPANILVARPGPEWWVKVADFGICSLGAMNSNKWEFRTFTGTPKYLAPEVFKIKWGGSAYGYSVDVWSNGAIAYLMLTGKSLPVDYVMQCRYDEKQPDLKLPAGTIISESGMLFLEKMLMEDPSARPKVIETFEKEWFQDDSGGDFSTSFGEDIAWSEDPKNPQPLSNANLSQLMSRSAAGTAAALPMESRPMHHLLLPEGACYDREGPQLNTQPRVKREEPTASSLKDPSSSSSLDHFQQKAARFLSPILTELAFKATLNYQWINLARQRQRPLPNSIDLPAPKEVAIVETWEETKELGRGAFGVVTLQRCISNTLPTTSGVDSVGMLRAVKSIPKTDYPDYHRELLALKTFCGSLGSYANNHLYNLRFVTFLGWYESPETIYIIVEYLPHGSLDSYLSHNHTTEDEAKDILHQILDGVAIVHSKGWAHRDLKPANILIETPGPEWRVKVADFGICVPGVLLGGEDAGEVGFKTFIGTPSFMAPEVFRARYEEKARYGNTVDIWSVGAMAYLMLTGQAVDEGYLERCRYGSGQPMLVWPEVVGPWKNWTVSEPARVFVEKCLQADPTRRPQTAQETLMGEWFFGPRDDADAELVPEVEVRDNRQTGYTFNSWKDDGEETGYGVDWRPGQKSAKWKDRTSLHLNAYDSDSSLGDEPYDHGVMRDEAGSEEEETVYKEWTE